MFGESCSQHVVLLSYKVERRRNRQRAGRTSAHCQPCLLHCRTSMSQFFAHSYPLPFSSVLTCVFVPPSRHQTLSSNDERENRIRSNTGDDITTGECRRIMSAVASSCWASVDTALEQNDATAAATAAREGLRATAYDERKHFFTQLCTAMLLHGRTATGASCVAEVGEQLWMMSEFRPTTSAAATVSGETLLLAAAAATAYMTTENYAKALAFDCELLQSPTFFTYDGFTVVERLDCVARMLAASRRTGSSHYVDAAVQKGVSLFHGLARAHPPPDAEGQRHREAVVNAYLFELGCYRQEHSDYLRAFQSFYALYEKSGQAEALQRAALTALCIRSSKNARQAALHDVLKKSGPSVLSSLHAIVHQAYYQQLFSAADTASLLAATGQLLPRNILRDALREHNILLLASAFDCVYWRSLCTHMDDVDLTEGELYDLLVGMMQAQRLVVSIHQDSGFIEFGSAGRLEVTDADVFAQVAQTAATVAATHPELLA